MTYRVSCGPADDGQTVEATTAAEALAIAERFRAEGRSGLAVSHTETGDVALEVLAVLAKYEAPGAPR